MAELTNFTMVASDDNEFVDLPSGHATSVRRQETLTGDIVVKEINTRTGLFNEDSDEDRRRVWFGNHKRAQMISGEIRTKKNPAYFVPKTFISHGKVREQFVSGQRLRDVWQGLSQDDKNWVYEALAQFINDMSELRPVRYGAKVRGVPRIGVRGIKGLQEFIGGWDEKYVSAEDKQLICDIYQYLSRTPENKMMVFGHNDLHGGNIMIDLEKRQLSIIDFEMAGYRPAFESMYTARMTDFENFWRYVNSLPRKNNASWQWNFVPEHRDLFKFLRWGYAVIALEHKTVESMSGDIKNACQKIRPVFERAKSKQKAQLDRQSLLPVPMSCYETEM